MAEEGVNIEMGERGEEEEREDDINETSFIDDNNEDSGSENSLFRPSDPVTRIEDGVPDAGSDVGSMKRSVTYDKKKIFREMLDAVINKGDGEASEELIEHTRFRLKDDRVNGAWFYDVLIMVSDRDGIRYSDNQSEKVKGYVDRFKKLLEKARTEHYNTPEGAVEQIGGKPILSEEVVADILSRSKSEIDGWAEERAIDLQEQMEGVFISKQEVREISGIINKQAIDTDTGTDTDPNMDTIKFLEIEVDNYRKKAEKEVNPLKKQLYDNVRKMAELKADSIRIRINERPEHTEAMSILSDEVENNDLNRLERFKRWARENMVGLSAIAITIAGIITTIVVATRRTVSGGAKAVGGFAKALANLGKSLGPLLAPLFSLVAQVLTWGAKGIAWLANNLWVRHSYDVVIV